MIGRSEIVPGLVSAIICTYNNWPDLEMTIESALNQSYQPIEVIVVDNSSTDATPEEVPRRFGGRVHYIRQPNKGWYASQRNAGFAVASGEFIHFLDGDDVLAPNQLAKQVEVFRAHPEFDIVYGDVRMFQTLSGIANWTDERTQPEYDMLKRLVAPEEPWVGLTTLGTLFHRRVLETVGPWDEDLYVADLDYWLRAAYAGCRFGHCPGSPMGFYRIRPGQMTKNVSAMNHGIEAVWDKALGYMKREPYSSLLVAKVAGWRFHMAVSRDQITTREALTKLALARATPPQMISALGYAVGYLTIVVPGGSALVRSRWLRPIRRALALLLRRHRPRDL